MLQDKQSQARRNIMCQTCKFLHTVLTQTIITGLWWTDSHALSPTNHVTSVYLCRGLEIRSFEVALYFPSITSSFYICLHKITLQWHWIIHRAKSAFNRQSWMFKMLTSNLNQTLLSTTSQNLYLPIGNQLTLHLQSDKVSVLMYHSGW